MNWVILKYELGYNHPKPSTTTHNHPQSSTTIHNHLKNRPKLSKTPTTIYNQTQPPTSTQKLPKKAKTCHIQLFYCNVNTDVNTETEVDFDSV